MLHDVLQRLPHQHWIVSKITETCVAMVAQERADCPARMVMVYSETTRLTTIFAAANLTAVILRGQ